MAENERQGISRRDLLKRGAALGGAVVWATPVVQTLGMGRAFAQTASPEVRKCSPDVSFIALCVTCGDDTYLIKWEAEGGGRWDLRDPKCGLDCGPDSTPKLGSELEFTVTDEDGDGCYTVSWTSDCEVTAGFVFGGNVCEPLSGPFTNGFEVCCPEE